MRYLMIENPGVVGTDLLTIVGASSARGEADMIGQFGSGFKYSVSLLLRKSLDLRLYIGKNGYNFEVDERQTKDVAGRSFLIREVVMRQVAGTSRRRKAMGFDVSFGEIDWRDATMAVREFVSNAADASFSLGKTYNSVRCQLVDEDQIKARDGYTRVFIQADEAVRDYYDSITENFILFNDEYDPNMSLLPKQGDSKRVRIYRKGVLVGSFEHDSLFDYNINDIELKESRVISETSAKYACSLALQRGTVDQVAEFLYAVKGHDKMWETEEIDAYHLKMDSWDKAQEANRPIIDTWTKAVARVFGDESVACDNEFQVDPVRMKGLRPVLMDTKHMLIVQSFGMKTTADVLDKFEATGKQRVFIGESVIHTASKVWAAMTELGMTADKTMPELEGYHDLMTSGSNVYGYWDPKSDRVGLSKDLLDMGDGFMLIKVLVEEFAHYVTKARDCTRDLQDYAFRVAAKLMQSALSGR